MADAAATFDTREYRRAVGAFPTGVTVATTIGADGAPVGITVNSFSSLSLEPPLVLWALKLRSPTMAAFERAPYFAINVLAEDQAGYSKLFASRQAHKFAGLDVRAGIGGVPLLAGAIARIECRTHAHHPGGDHVIVVGHVERFDHNPKKRPLVFWGGRYHEAGGELA